MGLRADDSGYMPTTEWTDERLDDLVNTLTKSLDRIDTDVRELRGDVKGLYRLGLVAAAGIIAAIIGTGILT